MWAQPLAVLFACALVVTSRCLASLRVLTLLLAHRVAASAAVSVMDDAAKKAEAAAVIDKTNPLYAPDNFEPWRNAGYKNLAPRGWNEWSDLPAPYKYYDVKVDPKDVENPGFLWKVFSSWKTGVPAATLLSLPVFVYDVRRRCLTCWMSSVHAHGCCVEASRLCARATAVVGGPHRRALRVDVDLLDDDRHLPAELWRHAEEDVDGLHLADQEVSVALRPRRVCACRDPVSCRAVQRAVLCREEVQRVPGCVPGCAQEGPERHRGVTWRGDAARRTAR